MKNDTSVFKIQKLLKIKHKIDSTSQEVFFQDIFENAFGTTKYKLERGYGSCPILVFTYNLVKFNLFINDRKEFAAVNLYTPDFDHALRRTRKTKDRWEKNQFKSINVDIDNGQICLKSLVNSYKILRKIALEEKKEEQERAKIENQKEEVIKRLEKELGHSAEVYYSSKNETKLNLHLDFYFEDLSEQQVRSLAKIVSKLNEERKKLRVTK